MIFFWLDAKGGKLSNALDVGLNQQKCTWKFMDFKSCFLKFVWDEGKSDAPKCLKMSHTRLIFHKKLVKVLVCLIGSKLLSKILVFFGLECRCEQLAITWKLGNKNENIVGQSEGHIIGF
jgi:hypothetical protein